MKKSLFIAVNAVFLNYPQNNLFKFTLKLLSLLMKTDTVNQYYVLYPCEFNLEKYIPKIPQNFNIIQAGENYFTFKKGNKIKKDRINYENNFHTILKKKTNIEFDIILTPYNFFPLKKLTNCAYWTVFHDVIPLLPFKFPPDRLSLASWYYLSWLDSLKWFFKKSRINNNNLLFTVTEFQKKEIKKLTPWKKDICLLGNWLPGKMITGRTGLTRESETSLLKEKYNINKKYILYVGSMTRRKNTRLLIKSFNNLPQNLLDTYELVIAGGNKFREDNVKGLGYVDEDDLPVLYKNTEIFISVTKYEGFGVPPLEALSFKKNLILSDLPVFREIFSDIPLFVDCFNSNAVTDAIFTMLEDNKKYKQNLNQKYKSIIEKYSEDNILKDYMQQIKLKRETS